jgi:hypothetical protein
LKRDVPICALPLAGNSGIVLALQEIEPASVEPSPPGTKHAAFQKKAPGHTQAGLNHLCLPVFFTGGHSITGSSSERKFLKRQFRRQAQKPPARQAYTSAADAHTAVIH